MACKRSSVRSRLPPPTEAVQVLTLSSRGLGHYPFTVSTGVRIPVGSPDSDASRRWQVRSAQADRTLQVAGTWLARAERRTNAGVVVQLVRIPACHAGGRGFESRPLRQSIYLILLPFLPFRRLRLPKSDAERGR